MGKLNKTKTDVCEIRNREVFHGYFVGETFEAGVALLGPEVKSLRLGRAQISNAFVRANGKGELFLYNSHIAAYEFHTSPDYNDTRPRKLLLHSSEISKIVVAIEREKAAVIPLKIFFKHGLAKVNVAICKGKKLFDKRETLKRKEAAREAERAISSKMRMG
ncbi:MAG: SsrA-binding protein SmpB [Puniceicoccales bacterium]|jgi:SsrA-binding protein|nr:SsrA-binding protein SmpB [Puniceicoccales bacterium]